ncbi:MAG: OmpA family protein [Desulfosporosinus sp.]|jgi:chemotaxis protein MotB
MSIKRENETEKDNSERWMLTYLDLITLLMIFFVVLYSISKVDAEKFHAIAESLNKAFGGTPIKIELASNPDGPSLLQTGTPASYTTVSGKGKDSNNTINIDPTESRTNNDTGTGNVDAEKMSLNEIKFKLDKFAADNNIKTKLTTSIEERGLVVSVQETLLFESGSAEITARAREILEIISTVLVTVPNQIKVEGHTDNLPINTAKFPSNWELSVIRATNVVNILQKEGISPNRLSATGYGEFRPISSNSTDVGRSKNRRIDLLILRSKYDLTEPSTLAPNPVPVVSTLTKKP